MLIKRLAVVIAVLLAGLFSPSVSAAQKDRLGFGESLAGKVIRPDRSEFDLSIHRTEAGTLKVAKGQLTATTLPPHIRAALAFLVRWGRGPSTVTGRATPDPATAVIIDGRNYSLRDVVLLPPIQGLSTIRDPAGRVTGIAVGVLAVRTKDGEVRGQGVLSVRQESDGWFTITGVTVQGR